MTASRRSQRPPLDPEQLDRLALSYVARYATTRARLSAYLARKLAERGWASDAAPQPEAIAARLADKGWIDDAGFARNRSAALTGRGNGPRLVTLKLRAAGVAEADCPAIDSDTAFAAALAFARRRRIGAFAHEPAGPELRRRQFAAFLRAGHAPELARRFLDARPGDSMSGDDIDNFADGLN